MPLLMPIDRSNSSFRMHQLMRDSLRLLLSRQDPGLSVRLHERAAHWYASVGQLDHAVQHLLLTDDPDAIDGAIWRAAPVFVASGRTATVSRWLERFSAEQRATRPALAVAQAWCALTDGDMRIARLLDVGRQQHGRTPDAPGRKLRGRGRGIASRRRRDGRGGTHPCERSARLRPGPRSEPISSGRPVHRGDGAPCRGTTGRGAPETAGSRGARGTASCDRTRLPRPTRRPRGR